MYFNFNCYFFNAANNYTERLNKFTWAAFENQCDLLLPECAKGIEKETNIDCSENLFKSAYCPTNKTTVPT